MNAKAIQRDGWSEHCLYTRSTSGSVSTAPRFQQHSPSSASSCISIVHLFPSSLSLQSTSNVKMQYKLLAISAFAATSFAQGNNQQASQSELYGSLRLINTCSSTNHRCRLSIVSVLQTALPSTLIQEYLTNSAAVSSELASDFSAGEYPDWFTSLPTAVQTYLVPAGNAANATGSSAPYISAAPTNSMNSTGNSTLSRTSRTPSLSSSPTGSPSSSGNGAQSSSDSGSSSSTGGASMPTAIMGMGLAGAVGLVGVLAL